MTESFTCWRLLKTPPAPGSWNMAVDEAILEAAGRGEALPTLRLYAWQPACLSLGFTQPAADADLTALNIHGWDLVRRPTGGRAILHTDELTYSVAGPLDEPRLLGGVLESYRRLSGALLQALHDLGIPAETQEQPLVQPGSDPKGAVCFEVPSNYEITVGGRKLIGSAQARRKEGVLQHGSLPLYGDLGRITQALVFEDETARQAARERLTLRATTAEKVLGAPLAWETAAQAIAAAFARVLHLDLQEGELSATERARAQELVASKYGHPDWTFRI